MSGAGRRKVRSEFDSRETHTTLDTVQFPPPTTPTLTFLCARLAAVTRCEKLPSDFIEKLPTSIIKIARNAFEDTPLADQCVARHIELARAKYILDKTGNIVTFKPAVTAIELIEEDRENVVKVIIPEGAMVLAENAFEGCKLLAAVTLPETLVEIGDEAFNE